MPVIKSPALGRLGGGGAKPAGCQSRASERAGSDAADGATRLTADELHERYVENVFCYVRHRVAQQEEAEDITAEVFAAAFAGLGRFRGQCPPYLWLLSIARRKIVDAQRRRKVRQETLASELTIEELEGRLLWPLGRPDEEPEAALVRAEARRMLGALVAGLNPDQREALLLQYVERLSVAEIAQVMGRSAGSVKGLLERAKGAIYRRGREYFEG